MSTATFPFNWSFSTLMQYEGCAFRVKLKKIDKVPEPPLPPDNPLEKGNRIHKRLELFVQGKGPMDEEAKRISVFKPALEHAQELHRIGQATTEEDWFFDADWETTQRNNVWLWSKIDLCVHDEAKNRVIVVDYKSGKSQYKTVEHVQQLQLYAAISALKFEWADEVHAELWYVDEGITRLTTYTREQALKYIGLFDRRVDKMYNDKFFRPNPNIQTCRYCPYSPRGNGACPVGV